MAVNRKQTLGEIMTNYRRATNYRRIVAAIVAVVALGGATIATAGPAEAVNGIRKPAPVSTNVNGI